MPITIRELGQFLVDAHRSTYANKDAPKVGSTRLKSEDYHFEKGHLAYHDTYFGGRDFIGGEIIYKTETPIWGMNYYGYVLKPAVSEKEVYDFLRKALMKECTDIIPVRGPKSYAEGEWRYDNVPSGSMERFIGVEEIYKNSELVYRANYHGGFIE